MANTAVQENYYGTGKTAQWGVANDQMSNTQKWLAFAVVFIFGACCVHQFQMVSPVLTQIGESFGMGLDSVGMIMTVFSFTGIVLTFPAMWIMQKIGVKTSIVITGIIGVIGDVLAIVAGSVTMFLFARVVQGCTFAMIAVIGPNLMPRLFPSSKLGLVMGIWGVWFTVGVMMSTIFTPMIYASVGWKGIFWFSAILLVVATILVVIFFKMPKVPESVVEHGTDEQQKELEAAGGKKTYWKSAIVVGCTFLAFEIVYMTWSSFYPTYGQEVQLLSIAASSKIPLVVTLVTVPMGIIWGIVCDKTVRAKEILIAGFAALFVICAFMLWGNGENMGLVWAGNILYAAIPVAAIPVAIRLLITAEAMTPKKTDLALTFMTLTTSLGGFFGVFFGKLVVATSWHTAGFALACVSILGLIAVIFCKGDHAIKVEREAEEQAKAE